VHRNTWISRSGWNFSFFVSPVKGCPTTQQWCLNTPAIQAIPLVASFMVTCIGYAFSTSMSTSTLTKVLATQDQVAIVQLSVMLFSLSPRPKSFLKGQLDRKMK